MTGVLPTFFRESVDLAPLTTIGLGGHARFFAECTTLEQLREALTVAALNEMRWIVLGEGSNLIFPDTGFGGIVLKIALRGIVVEDDGKNILFNAGAGEEWDSVVQHCVARDWGGTECLSGIPGLVGATPIQNVGAYGQEVSETIVSVEALDSETMRVVTFRNDQCRFGYRQSRFKQEDRNRYVITGVSFRFPKNADPTIRYPELRAFIDSGHAPGIQPDLRTVRDSVLILRKQKSMVIDPTDPNSRSVGSFFVNPRVPVVEFAAVEKRWKASGGGETIPSFRDGEYLKIPAAWLVEHAGFRKGEKRSGVGISSNHSLALINDGGGTTRALLAFAGEIQSAVRARFGIILQTEPTIVE